MMSARRRVLPLQPRELAELHGPAAVELLLLVRDVLLRLPGPPRLQEADLRVESYIPVCCCCNVCGRVQLAQELGIKAFDFKRVKEGASASGETFKSDVMMRNL